MPIGCFRMSRPLSTSSLTCRHHAPRPFADPFVGRAVMAKPAWTMPIRPSSSDITSYAASTHRTIVLAAESFLPCALNTSLQDELVYDCYLMISDRPAPASPCQFGLCSRKLFEGIRN